jgi:FecR protein
MRLRRLILCLPALLIGSANALAAPGDTIGSAVTIVNLVTAQLNNDQRKLASGDDVRQQELIEVAADGHGDLMLRDDTKLALGPGARLLLDQFVYNPDISGGAIVLDLVRGAFRFITGVAAKPAYVIRTPTASITVRGTIFDVYVQESGVAWLLLIEGAVQVCAENGKCIVDDEPGKLIRIGSDDVDKPVKWASLPQKRDVSFESAFPFIVTAPEIDPGPHFTRDQIVLGTFPERPGKSDGDKADSDDDGGKKADEDKPRHKADTHERRRREVRRRRRHHEDDASASKPNFPIGIGIGIGGFGHHHGGGEGGGGNYGGGHKGK